MPRPSNRRTARIVLVAAFLLLCWPMTSQSRGQARWLRLPGTIGATQSAGDPLALPENPRPAAAPSRVHPPSAQQQPPSEQEPEYVGSRACRRCHLREYRSWQGGKHANVFELLEPGVRPEAKVKVNLQPDVDYRTNELCLQCHTVGYGTPSGFTSVEETPDLVGIGCETCHGPGSVYIRDDVMGNDNLDHSFEEVIAAGLVYPVPEEVCRSCHGDPATPFNPELFPEYTFEYDRETVEAGTHVHLPLARDHGPLPPGVMFQGSGGR
jgi:hypothetical protein